MILFLESSEMMPKLKRALLFATWFGFEIEEKLEDFVADRRVGD